MVSLNFKPVNHRRVERKDKNKNLKINKSILLLNPAGFISIYKLQEQRHIYTMLEPEKRFI